MKIFLKFIFTLLFASCDNYSHKDIDPSMSLETANILLKKYDKETFNYFYETIFKEDHNAQKLTSIKKWKEDIRIFIKGYPTKFELLAIDNLLIELKGLKITIRIKLTKKIEEANVLIYFDKKENLDDKFVLNESTSGISTVSSRHGSIYYAQIGIVKKEDNRNIAVLIEEIIQTLGIVGDSYSYPNSIFYEGINFQTELTELDKNIIKLLYDPLIPVNFSRLNFENYFGSVLKNIDYETKLVKYIKENNIDKTILKSTKNCFIDGEFYKHPTTIAVYLQGDYSEKDSLHTLKTINNLNQIENINLELKNYTRESPEAGVTIFFSENVSQKHSIETTYNTTRGQAMFPKRIQNEVFISSKDQSTNTQEKKLIQITESLYKCLGPIYSEDIFINEEPISLKTEQLDLLRFIYSDVLIDGLKLTDYNKILDENKIL